MNISLMSTMAVYRTTGSRVIDYRVARWYSQFDIHSYCSGASFADMSFNSQLKGVFQKINERIVDNVNPASVIDRLIQDTIITKADYDDLTPDSLGKTEKMRRIMALLYNSNNPQAFIVLRKALEKEYEYFVKEVDQLCLKAGIITNYWLYVVVFIYVCLSDHEFTVAKWRDTPIDVATFDATRKWDSKSVTTFDLWRFLLPYMVILRQFQQEVSYGRAQRYTTDPDIASDGAAR